eukprot:5972625-Pyramimonas_sp.AAC.1
MVRTPTGTHAMVSSGGARAGINQRKTGAPSGQPGAQSAAPSAGARASGRRRQGHLRPGPRAVCKTAKP